MAIPFLSFVYYISKYLSLTVCLLSYLINNLLFYFILFRFLLNREGK